MFFWLKYHLVLFSSNSTRLELNLRKGENGIKVL